EHPEREAKCNRYAHDFSSSYVRRRTPCPIPFAAAFDGLFVRHSRTLRCTVEDGKSVHLTWGQLHGDRAHLLVDIVLAQPLGKSCQLALDVRGGLANQRRGTDLVAIGAMTCSARRNAALLISNECQALRGIAFFRPAVALQRPPARNRRQP